MASHSPQKDLSYSDGFMAGYHRGYDAAVEGLRDTIIEDITYARPRRFRDPHGALVQTLEAVAKGEIEPSGFRRGGVVTGGTDACTTSSEP
jgi:hypothetical protein